MTHTAQCWRFRLKALKEAEERKASRTRRHNGRNLTAHRHSSDEEQDAASGHTTSSSSGRSGQNGARAGPNGLKGSPTQPFRQAGSANAGAARTGGRFARGRLDRESSKSGDSTGAVPRGIAQRPSGPSRFGPGRGNGQAAVAKGGEPLKNGRKRQLQVFFPAFHCASLYACCARCHKAGNAQPRLGSMYFVQQRRATLALEHGRCL